MLAGDTFYELQDTLEHLADARVERFPGLEKVIGENNTLEVQEEILIAWEEARIAEGLPYQESWMTISNLWLRMWQIFHGRLEDSHSWHC